MLNVTILSPEQEIFKGKIASLFVPTLMGEMEIFPNHTALLATLSVGYMIIRHHNGSEDTYFITGGYVDIQDKVNVVIENAYTSTQVTHDFLTAELEKAKNIAANTDAELDKKTEYLARYEQLLAGVAA